jgi:hypothetical protein
MTQLAAESILMRAHVFPWGLLVAACGPSDPSRLPSYPPTCPLRRASLRDVRSRSGACVATADCKRARGCGQT